MSPRGAGLLCALVIITAQLAVAYAQQAVPVGNAPVQMPAPGVVPTTNNLAAPQVPQGGAGQQGGGQTTSTTTTATVDPKGGNQTADSGFGAGSIFLAILFGMALMFGLLQGYSYWVRRNY